MLDTGCSTLDGQTGAVLFEIARNIQHQEPSIQKRTS